MRHKENVNPLKTLVISMGLLLIGGTVFLAGVVWKKVSHDVAEHKASGSCSGGEADLRGHGVMVDSVIQGQALFVTFEKQEGLREIVRVDTCTGKETGSLIVHTDPPLIEE